MLGRLFEQNLACPKYAQQLMLHLLSFCMASITHGQHMMCGACCELHAANDDPRLCSPLRSDHCEANFAVAAHQGQAPTLGSMQREDSRPV